MAVTPKTIDVTASVDMEYLLGALAGRMINPDTWDQVAEAIGVHPYVYDLGDSSERVDVVQIVCEAIARTLAGSAA